MVMEIWAFFQFKFDRTSHYFGQLEEENRGMAEQQTTPSFMCSKVLDIFESLSFFCFQMIYIFFKYYWKDHSEKNQKL